MALNTPADSASYVTSLYGRRRCFARNSTPPVPCHERLVVAFPFRSSRPAIRTNTLIGSLHLRISPFACLQNGQRRGLGIPRAKAPLTRLPSDRSPLGTPRRFAVPPRGLSAAERSDPSSHIRGALISTTRLLLHPLHHQNNFGLQILVRKSSIC